MIDEELPKRPGAKVPYWGSAPHPPVRVGLPDMRRRRDGAGWPVSASVLGALRRASAPYRPIHHRHLLVHSLSPSLTGR
jgi:hypothetical protein